MLCYKETKINKLIKIYNVHMKCDNINLDIGSLLLIVIIVYLPFVLNMIMAYDLIQYISRIYISDKNWLLL